MELVAFVQKEYGIEVGPQELVRDNFDSVNKLARYVASKQNPAANAA
jgi:acyl carrier protein